MTILLDRPPGATTGRHRGGRRDYGGRLLDRHDRATMGERVRAARYAAGLTVRELAETLDVDPNTVISWQHGTLPGPANRTELAAVLGVPEPVLFSEYQACLAVSRLRSVGIAGADPHDLAGTLTELAAWCVEIAGRVETLESEVKTFRRAIAEPTDVARLDVERLELALNTHIDECGHQAPDVTDAVNQLQFEIETLNAVIGEHIDDEGWPDGFAHGHATPDGNGDHVIEFPEDIFGDRVAELERRLDAMVNAAARP